MSEILDILSREWPLISGAPVLVIGGGAILVIAAFTIAWMLKTSIDDGELRGYKAQLDLTKQREAYAKDKQDELEKQVADLKAKIAANAPQVEVDESVGKVSVALEEAKAANNAVNYVLNAEPGQLRRGASVGYDDLIEATGTSFPVGYVPPPTALSGFSKDELRHRIALLKERALLFEQNFRDEIRTVTTTLRPNGLSEEQYRIKLQELTTKKSAIEAQHTTECQTQYLPEFRSLHDEMLIRMNLPFPRCSSSGLSIDGYRAIMTGILSGNTPVQDLVVYLATLSVKLS
jgi:hypothetical protein